jgi:hypothetical protein
MPCGQSRNRKCGPLSPVANDLGEKRLPIAPTLPQQSHVTPCIFASCPAKEGAIQVKETVKKQKKMLKTLLFSAPAPRWTRGSPIEHYVKTAWGRDVRCSVVRVGAAWFCLALPGQAFLE